MAKKLALWGAVSIASVSLLLLLAIQAVPYGKDHSNPPVIREPAWSSPEIRQLAVRACYDCHSNETRWPWYSSVAPVSWLVQRDVDEGRDELNFSRWDSGRNEVDDAAETIQEGEMPPWFYVVLHPEANLSEQEKAALSQALQSMSARGRNGD